MGVSYTTDDLVAWDERIRERVEAFGLTCFDQEFAFCDHAEMLGYMAYAGMPARYPHWSFGKAYERLKTLYDYGVSGLPYEMVINADPSLAYLMRGNSLALQVLTIAHVYGHNDFFRNNFTFRHTRPERTVSAFKARAERVRSYVEDPSIGLQRVERVLDAAHALSLQCQRNFAVRRLDRAEQEARALAAATPQPDPFQGVHRRPHYVEPDLQRTPLEPDPDLLLFIRDHNPRLAAWERDLLTIVDEEARYFIPQIETKIINEGWATYWHHRILGALDLPEDLRFEFLIRHNQVVRPLAGELNPYHLGFRLWRVIAGDEDEDGVPRDLDPKSPPPNLETMFGVREVDRDASFLRRFLGPRLMRRLGLFEFEPYGEDLVVTRISDDDGWQAVRDTLIRNVGTNAMPVIVVVDADLEGRRALLLRHEHDGRDLELEHAEKTLAHVHALWGREVVLETIVGGRRRHLRYSDDGFALTAAR